MPATTPEAIPEQPSVTTKSTPEEQKQKRPKVRVEKKTKVQAAQATSTSAAEPKTLQPTPETKIVETPNTEITTTPLPETTEEPLRLPLNVLAAYRKPLRHTPTHGVRVASLQLRSYSVRNLEFMCDFALRAAYFLGLPASGPVPLPKKIERWTMPRANFAHKKSQENFERITRRRAIQILDGHKDGVQIWLAYLRKHQFYGVGMKADVWEFEGMDVAASMDAQFQEVEKQLDEKLSMFGWNKQVAGDQSLTEQLRNMGPGQQTGASMMHIREDSRSESRL
jgi:small subunit ribosomal protein S10